MARAGWLNTPTYGCDVGWDTDRVSGDVTIKYKQDIRQILSSNQFRRRSEDNSRRRRSGQFHQVAEIPLIIVMKWKNELGVDINNPDHWPDVVKLLHDPEWRDATRVADTNFMKRPSRSLFVGAGFRR